MSADDSISGFKRHLSNFFSLDSKIVQSLINGFNELGADFDAFKFSSVSGIDPLFVYPVLNTLATVVHYHTYHSDTFEKYTQSWGLDNEIVGKLNSFIGKLNPRAIKGLNLRNQIENTLYDWAKISQFSDGTISLMRINDENGETNGYVPVMKVKLVISVADSDIARHDVFMTLETARLVSRGFENLISSGIEESKKYRGKLGENVILTEYDL